MEPYYTTKEVLEAEFWTLMSKAMMQASIIANCVFNAFFGFTAITFNIVTILALRKPLTIPRAVKTLLMSLVVSDLSVGLLVQPLYATLLVMRSRENTQNSTFDIVSHLWENTAYFFTYASFFAVVAIAADRFLAIYLHLRYQELVTHKRVVAVVISIWILSAILTLLFRWTPNVEAFIVVAVDSVCYLTTALFYVKIYLAVRHHSNHIHFLQEQLSQNNGGDIANVVRERKTAVGTFYVYLVFLICYLPFTCYQILYLSARPTTVLRHFELYSEMLTYLNSSLNPLIYSWKMRHVRHAIMEILRNIFLDPHNWENTRTEQPSITNLEVSFYFLKISISPTFTLTLNLFSVKCFIFPPYGVTPLKHIKYTAVGSELCRQGSSWPQEV